MTPSKTLLPIEVDVEKLCRAIANFFGNHFPLYKNVLPLFIIVEHENMDG